MNALPRVSGCDVQTAYGRRGESFIVKLSGPMETRGLATYVSDGVYKAQH